MAGGAESGGSGACRHVSGLSGKSSTVLLPGGQRERGWGGLWRHFLLSGPRGTAGGVDFVGLKRGWANQQPSVPGADIPGLPVRAAMFLKGPDVGGPDSPALGQRLLE